MGLILRVPTLRLVWQGHTILHFPTFRKSHRKRTPRDQFWYPKSVQGDKEAPKNRKKCLKMLFLERFIFRRFFGKHFCRFFSILGFQNGVQNKNNHKLFSSLFRTFEAFATFRRFLSIFVDFGPHEGGKIAENRRKSSKI